MPRAIHAAHDAGFAAFELHWPYATEPGELRAALDMTGLPVLGLNTVCGKIANGEFGLAAVPGREADARAAIDRALTYAQAIKCRNVHVMAGRAEGAMAEGTFAADLAYAAAQARDHGVGILIEPLNLRDVPGHFLSDLDKAARIIETVGDDNVHIMFDCYHMQIMGGDLLNRIRAHLPFIGHVQFAAVPDRQNPIVCSPSKWELVVEQFHLPVLARPSRSGHRLGLYRNGAFYVSIGADERTRCAGEAPAVEVEGTGRALRSH